MDEDQHREATALFDKPDRITVSGVFNSCDACRVNYRICWKDCSSRPAIALKAAGDTIVHKTDVAAIKAASEKLNEAWQAVSAELYKSTSAKAGGSGPQGGPQGAGAGQGAPQDGGKKEEEGPIIDAEVVDEKK